MALSSDNCKELIDLIATKISPEMEIKAVEVEFNKGIYSCKSKLFDKKSNKFYTLTATLSPIEGNNE